MIPTFNCADYLAVTLRSVLEQDPGPALMQIEVVDDHSSLDDPEEVTRSIGGDRVLFTRQSHNVGTVANFQTCLHRARGHLVHILHGDDYVLEGFYESMQRGFAHGVDVGLAFCRHQFVDEHGELISISEPELGESGVLDDALLRLAREQRIMTPSVVVKRAAYELLGGFDSRLSCTEDWEMWVRVAARFQVWYEARTLAAYRMHSRSNTGRNRRGAVELQYTRLAIELIKKHLPAHLARGIARSARRTYAVTALETAGAMAERGSASIAMAYIREAFRLSRSMVVIAKAVRTTPRIVAGMVRGRSGLSGEQHSVRHPI